MKRREEKWGLRAQDPGLGMMRTISILGCWEGDLLGLQSSAGQGLGVQRETDRRCYVFLGKGVGSS